MRAAITRATSADPDARFPSVSTFADALAAIDLGAAAPTVRLAPEARGQRPFRWLTGALRVRTVAADIQRADFRLRDLIDRGLIDAGAGHAFLASRGFSDMGFSVWASTVRLGPIDDPRLLSRVAELAILLHGWSGTREVWSLVAPALCRDNAQAVVITPDLHGFGETGFDGVPSKEKVELSAIARSIEGLRRVLGISDIPVAMVGHSMAGASLLTQNDEEVGPHVSRVLINPVLVSHDRRLERRLRMMAYLTRTVGRIGPLRRWIIRTIARTDPNLRVLTQEARDNFMRESLRMTGGVYARVLSAFTRSPPKVGRQRRLAILACLDDDWIDEKALDAAARDIGLEPAQIHRAASGGHNPHAELADHPEWTARNIDQIVRVIDSMLITARETTMVSTEPREAPPTSGSTSASGETATAQTYTRA